MGVASDGMGSLACLCLLSRVGPALFDVEGSFATEEVERLFKIAQFTGISLSGMRPRLAGGTGGEDAWLAPSEFGECGRRTYNGLFD
jgi:hypothetical protein